MLKVCGYPPTVEEEFLSHLPKPAKSLARVPSLQVRLVILPGVFPFRGQWKVSTEIASSRRCSLSYKSFHSASQTWIALNIVKQPCVGTIEILYEMKE